MKRWGVIAIVGALIKSCAPSLPPGKPGSMGVPPIVCKDIYSPSPEGNTYNQPTGEKICVEYLGDQAYYRVYSPTLTNVVSTQTGRQRQPYVVLLATANTEADGALRSLLFQSQKEICTGSGEGITLNGSFLSSMQNNFDQDEYGSNLTRVITYSPGADWQTFWFQTPDIAASLFSGVIVEVNQLCSSSCLKTVTTSTNTEQFEFQTDPPPPSCYRVAPELPPIPVLNVGGGERSFQGFGR